MCVVRRTSDNCWYRARVQNVLQTLSGPQARYFNIITLKYHNNICACEQCTWYFNVFKCNLDVVKIKTLADSSLLCMYGGSPPLRDTCDRAWPLYHAGFWDRLYNQCVLAFASFLAVLPHPSPPLSISILFHCIFMQCYSAGWWLPLTGYVARDILALDFDALSPSFLALTPNLIYCWWV